MKDIGASLKAARVHAGLSAEAAADALGMRRQSIYLIEKDGSTSFETFFRLCDLYGVLPGDIMPRSSGPVVITRTPRSLEPLADALEGFPDSARSVIIASLAGHIRAMGNVFSMKTEHSMKESFPTRKESSDFVAPFTSGAVSSRSSSMPVEDGASDRDSPGTRRGISREHAVTKKKGPHRR